MDALRVWVISLITVSVLCSLIEEFAPKGSLNKYVKLTCGLVVALVIAGPVIKFLGGDFNILEVGWNDYIILSKGEMEKRIQRLEEEEARQLLDIYGQSLISDVMYRYQGEKEFMVREVDLVLQEDSRSSDYGAVRELYIKIGPHPDRDNTGFSRTTEHRIINEMAEAFGIERSRVMVDSSAFEGR